jgi:hypothetical protein
MIDAVAVQIRIVRLLKRSANTPPHGVRTSVGSIWMANVIPSQAPEFVNSRTSQAWASFCIQVPVTDTDCPVKNSR